MVFNGVNFHVLSSLFLELTLAKLRQGSRRAFEPSMKASSPDNLSASPDNPQQICDDPSTKNLKLIDSHSGE